MKRTIHYNQVGFILGMQGLFNIWKSINAIHHTNRLKKKITWSIDAEKISETIPTFIHDKNSQPDKEYLQNTYS